MLIKVAYVNPPIPVRNFDWQAYIDGQEEDGPVGYGNTRQEAIDDLMFSLEELGYDTNGNRSISL